VNSEYRNIVRKRCGIHENDKRKNLRICIKHKIVMEIINVIWHPINQENSEVINVQMYLPTKILNADSVPTSEEKNERNIRINQREIRSCLSDPVLRTSLEAYENTASRSARNTLGLIINAIDHLRDTITPEQTFIDDHDNMPMHFDYETKDKYKTKDKVRNKTMFRINRCSDKHIKQHTGFNSLSCMICFILVVCKGDVETMLETTTQLTYFEEWLLYFTSIWGRTCT
jgi:hypothetical protein